MPVRWNSSDCCAECESEDFRCSSRLIDPCKEVEKSAESGREVPNPNRATKGMSSACVLSSAPVVCGCHDFKALKELV